MNLALPTLATAVSLIQAASAFAVETRPLCLLLAPPAISEEKVFLDAEVRDSEKDREALRLSFGTLSNETDIFLLRDAIKKGGGFIGVGADQVLTLAAMGRAEAVWVYDIDPSALMAAQRLTEMSRHFTTLSAFLSGIEAKYSELDPSFILFIKSIATRTNDSGKTFGILGNETDFQWFRSLALEGKIHFAFGSHLQPDLFIAIGRDAKKRGITINNIYVSNSLQFQWLATGGKGVAGAGFIFPALLTMAEVFPKAVSAAQKALRQPIDLSYLNTPANLEGLYNAYDSFKTYFVGRLAQIADPFAQFQSNLTHLPFASDARVLTTSIEVEPFILEFGRGHTVIASRVPKLPGKDANQTDRPHYSYAPASLYLNASPLQMQRNVLAFYESQINLLISVVDQWAQLSGNQLFRTAIEEKFKPMLYTDLKVLKETGKIPD